MYRFDIGTYESKTIFGSSFAKYVGFDTEQALKVLNPSRLRYAKNSSYRALIQGTRHYIIINLYMIRFEIRSIPRRS